MLSVIQHPTISLPKKISFIQNNASEDTIANILKNIKYYKDEPQFAHSLKVDF